MDFLAAEEMSAVVAADIEPLAMIRGSRWFAAAQAVVLLSGFVLQVTVGRLLSSADYGRFVVVHSVGLVLVTVLMSVVPNAVRQTVSVNPGMTTFARRMIWRVQWPLAFVVAATLALLSRVFGTWFKDAELGVAFRWLAIDLTLKAGLLEPSWYLLNGLGHHRRQAVLIAGHGFFRLLFVVSALLQWGTLESALIGLIVATVLSSCLAVVGLRSQTQEVDSALLTSESLRRLVTPWLKFSLLVDVLNPVLAFVSLWVLKSMQDDFQTGAYAACQMLVQPLLPLGLVLSRAAFSPFARAVAESRREAATLILTRCFRWAALFVGLGYVVTQQSGSFLLSLIYGAPLASEGRHLGTLFLGMSGLAMTSFCCEMMAAGYWLSARCRVICGLTLFALPLSIVLVRIEGSSGAASATLLTGIAGLVVMVAVLKRLVGSFVCWRSLIHAVLATAVAGVFGTLLISSVGVLPELIRVAFVTGCYAATVGLLFCFSRAGIQLPLENQA